MTPKSIEELISQRVVEALTTYEANQNNRNLINDDGNEGGDGGGNDNGNGGNENWNGNNNNRSGNHGENEGRAIPTTCEFTYKDFLNCQPLNFKETEGAVGLARWVEKMKSVFHISNCTPKMSVGANVAYAMTWKELMKLMTKVYCPRNEILKMENEL
nr:hypothetical protein [Tanacetum cinerariifolium]